jgi:tRNA(Arg) A34 adenosine deaminase TadA
MREALTEAHNARDEGNVGVGTVIVRQGEIVARGRNLVSAT